MSLCILQINMKEQSNTEKTLSKSQLCSVTNHVFTFSVQNQSIKCVYALAGEYYSVFSIHLSNFIQVISPC